MLPTTRRAPERSTPIAARPIVNGPAPKVLARRMRTIEPPTLVSTISRIVWSSKPSAARLDGVAACGAAPQVATQFPGVVADTGETSDGGRGPSTVGAETARAASGWVAYRWRWTRVAAGAGVSNRTIPPAANSTATMTTGHRAGRMKAGVCTSRDRRRRCYAGAECGQPSVRRTSPSTLGPSSSAQYTLTWIPSKRHSWPLTLAS